MGIILPWDKTNAELLQQLIKQLMFKVRREKETTPQSRRSRDSSPYTGEACGRLKAAPTGCSETVDGASDAVACGPMWASAPTKHSDIQKLRGDAPARGPADATRAADGGRLDQKPPERR